MSPTASQAANQDSRTNAAPKKRKGCLFWFAVFFAVVLMLALIAVGLLWYAHRLATTRPDFWKQRDQMVQTTPTVDLDRIASEAEQYVGNHLTGPKLEAGAPSRVELELSFDQINAWLSSRFPNWATHQGFALPPQIKGTMITQDAGKLLFSADIKDASFTGVITLRFDVRLVDPGDSPGLLVKLDSVESGELPVSMSLLSGMLGNGGSGQQETRKWLDLLNSGYRFPASTVIDSKAGRQLQLENLQITPTGIKAIMAQTANPKSVTPVQNKTNEAK